MLIKRREQINYLDNGIEELIQTYCEIMGKFGLPELTKEETKRLEEQLEYSETEAERLRAILVTNGRVLTFKGFVRRHYELQSIDTLYKRMPYIGAISHPRQVPKEYNPKRTLDLLEEVKKLKL